MKDPLGIHLRLREGQVLTALRRVIPGDYKTVTEANHPSLDAAGFTFRNARVFDHMTKSVPALFLDEAVAEKREPVAGVLRSEGEWTFIMEGAGAAGLWLLSYMDFPDRFIKGLPVLAGGCGPLLLKPLKQGWLVGVQAIFLKGIIKHGRGDSQFSKSNY